MSLIDTLRGLEPLPPSHQPVSAELLEIVGKVIAYVEFGEDFLAADEQDRKARDAGEPATHVDDLLSPPPPSEPSAAASGAAPPSAPAAAVVAPPAPPLTEVPADVPPSPAPDKDAEIALLKQQVATLLAQTERTQLDTAAETPVPPAGQ